MTKSSSGYIASERVIKPLSRQEPWQLRQETWPPCRQCGKTMTTFIYIYIF